LSETLDQNKDVLIKLRLDILKQLQMLKKIPLILTAQGVDRDEFYSYEGGPNESQRGLKRED